MPSAITPVTEKLLRYRNRNTTSLTLVSRGQSDIQPGSVLSLPTHISQHVLLFALLHRLKQGNETRSTARSAREEKKAWFKSWSRFLDYRTILPLQENSQPKTTSVSFVFPQFSLTSRAHNHSASYLRSQRSTGSGRASNQIRSIATQTFVFNAAACAAVSVSWQLQSWATIHWRRLRGLVENQ